MKPLVIYHANCADGFGAAFAAWLTLGDEAEYVACRYGEEFTYITEIAASNCEVYILDFSFPRGVMDLIFKHSKRVVWLDHHKTAFEMWGIEQWIGRRYEGDPDNHMICLDSNKSGAMLAWEYFHPGTEVPMFIKHIDDYDRWVFAIEGTKAFNKALWSAQSWNFPQWKELLESDIRPMYKAGKAILCAHEQNVQAVVKGSARNCEIPFDEEGALDCVEPRLEWNNGGYWMVHGLAANCPPHLTSDVGHELATQSGTFGLCWTLGQSGTVAKCSLRSNGEYDVSAIAKSFGGGGHRNAAGFEVDIQTLLGWLK